VPSVPFPVIRLGGAVGSSVRWCILVRSNVNVVGDRKVRIVYESSGGTRALGGLVVADFSRVLAGPLATMILGDLGADVIKVERPEVGDDTRVWGPPWHAGTSSYFQGLNRNKRSLTLDLREPSDRELARRLAARADILVENFRPGTMSGWGLGYADLAAMNPGLIYCSISGFGSAGAGAVLPGYDLLVQATSGLMSITGQPGGPPTKVSVALIDKIAGLYALSGILAALHARDTGGRGQHLEVPLFDAGIAALLNVGSGHLLAGATVERRGNRHPSIAPYQTYRASDRQFVLAVGSDQLWRRMCELIGRPGLLEDPAFATNESRVANIDRLEAELEEALAARTAEDWIAIFRQAGVPAGPVNTIAEAFEFADDIGRDLVVETPMEDGSTFRSVRSPIRLATTPAEVRSAPPRLGDNDAEIRAWLAQDPPAER